MFYFADRAKHTADYNNRQMAPQTASPRKRQRLQEQQEPQQDTYDDDNTAP